MAFLPAFGLPAQTVSVRAGSDGRCSRAPLAHGLCPPNIMTHKMRRVVGRMPGCVHLEFSGMSRSEPRGYLESESACVCSVGMTHCTLFLRPGAGNDGAASLSSAMPCGCPHVGRVPFLVPAGSNSTVSEARWRRQLPAGLRAMKLQPTWSLCSWGRGREPCSSLASNRSNSQATAWNPR